MSNLSNTGVVVSVRGSVVDIRFDGDLPSIHSVLRAGEEERIIIKVLGYGSDAVVWIYHCIYLVFPIQGDR